MKIKLILFLIIYQMALFGQTKNGFINTPPQLIDVTAPTMASFNKYISNPIGLYNGKTDVNIPLYTLKDGQIQIPITLRYNTSGIKVDEEASWVGLGWNLDVGGVITQYVVGDVDNLDSEYIKIIDLLNVRNTSVTKYNSPTYTSALHDAFKTYVGYNGKYSGKLNPDVFFFSFPGGSGKFFIDYRNDSIYLLNRTENLKIEIVNNTSNYEDRRFEITTTEGIKHTFSYIAKFFSSSPYKDISLSYALTSSQYPNGQKVYYTYNNYPIEQAKKTEYFQSNYANVGSQYLGNTYAGSSVSFYEGSDIYLSSIYTPNYKIDFNTDIRLDLVNGKKLLSIKIQALSDVKNEIKFQFNYDYFVSGEPIPTRLYIPEISEEQTRKRLKLLEVFQSSETEKINNYSFLYEETELPNKYSYAIDYWGYYNGKKDNYGLLPKITELTWGRNVANISQYESLWEIVKSDKSFGSMSCFNSRSYDYNYCKAGMLKQINYPTGGYMNYNYEPNDFNEVGINLSTPTKIYHNAQDWNNSGSSDSFTLSRNKTAKIKFVLNRGLNTWYDIWNAGGGSILVVAVYQSNVVQIKSYNFKDDCLYNANHSPDNNEIVFEESINLPSHFDENKPYTYFMYAYFPDQLGDQYGSSTKHGSTQLYIEYPTDESLYTMQTIQGCGVRVKSTKYFDKSSDTSPSLQKLYTYTDGVLLDQIQFVKPFVGLYYFEMDNPYNYYYGPVHTLANLNTMEISSENIINNPYGQNSGVGYSSVKEIDSTFNTTIYNFHNVPSDFAVNSVRLDDPLNGKLLNKTKLKMGIDTVENVNYHYNPVSKRRYWGINFLDRLNLFPNIYSVMPPDTRLDDYFLENEHPSSEMPIYPEDRINIIMHDLTAYDIHLTNETTTKDGVESKISYQYNPETFQLKSKTVDLSEGGELTYNYTYPNDYSWEPYISLKNANRISETIEEKVIKNGNILESFLREYKLSTDANKVLPYKDYKSVISNETGNPITISNGYINTGVYPKDHITYSRYNTLGNLESCILENYLNVVYLWSYNNQFPVAEIRNATFTEVESAVKSIFSVLSIEDLSTKLIPNETKLKDGSLQRALPMAHVTTYTYKPLAGMTSKTDPSGVTTTCEYDGFGRLKCTKDKDGKILQSYDYHYSNQ